MMSLSGDVVFYSTFRPDRPQDRLLRLLEAAGVEQVLSAWRTLDEDRTWDFIQRNLRAVGDKAYIQATKDLNVRGLGLIDVASLYQDDRYLTIDVGPAAKRFGSRVWRAVHDGIPEEIRGNFEPAAMYIGVGYHDLTECINGDEDCYVARAFFSVEFFGYGVPHQWRETNRLIFELPGIIEVKRELEAILGPLEGYAHWSV